MRARLVAVSMLAALVAGGPARAKDANEGRLTPFLSSIGQHVNHLNHQIAHFVTEASSRPVTAAWDSTRANMREGITVPAAASAPELASPAQPIIDARPQARTAFAASTGAAKADSHKVIKASVPRQNRAARTFVDSRFAGAGAPSVDAEIVWEAPRRPSSLRSKTVSRLDHVLPGLGDALRKLTNLTASDALLAFAACSVLAAAVIGGFKARQAYKEIIYLD